VLFFVSGFPALIYQIVWQRSLFTIYGVNIESVTVVVGAFMLGLGLGSIAGGYVSKNPRIPVVAAFSFTELVVGLYGFSSLRLFEWVGTFTIGSPPLKVGLITFLLVLVPTLMMGATLPLLVAYLVRQTSNVGRSTGTLYFFNTLGSACASLCAATFLLKTFGKKGSVNLAACLNLLVAACALALYLKQKPTARKASATAPADAGTVAGRTALPFKMALVLVFVSGFMALSYEITWFRIIDFALASAAATFPLMLSMYLAGIAWGAAEARRFFRTRMTAPRWFMCEPWRSFPLLPTCSVFSLSR
jgi:predicted membrane-bound spermidine synthase